MAAATDLRRLALALPEVYEDTHRGLPAFRVRARILAMLGGERPVLFERFGGGPPVAVLKLDREDQLNLAAAHPGAVEPAERYGHNGWTYVWLEAVDEETLALLIRLAWANVAPKSVSRP